MTVKKTKKKAVRLLKAKEWIKQYTGKKIVRGYAKKFCVDKLTAINELRSIGVDISQEYEKALRHHLELQKQQKLERKRALEAEQNVPIWDCDENFAFIIGYTSGGAPYGITHEEWEEMSNTD